MERLDAFMARANAAYYATHDPFADFTTSPEITQVFGELLGVWAAVAWDLMGRPEPVLLVEAGPGRGTLMADALRAVGQVAPAFRAALSLHLIETSPRLRALQAARLPGATWHASLATVPRGPLLLLANEFLDALPIRQFVRRGDVWMERFVEEGAFVEQVATSWPGLTRPSTHACSGTFAPGAARSARADGGVKPGHDEICPPGHDETCPPGHDQICPPGHDQICPPGHDQICPPGHDGIHELCEPARGFIADLGARLAARHGAALFLDYGPEHSTAGDSLQAIADGRPADPLSPPGTADLTAHVDFAALAAIARAGGAAVHGPVPQGPFLAGLGLFQRTGRLARGQPPRRAGALIEAAQRLAEPDRMGRLFKAMAVCHPDCPTPPGFAA